MAKVKVALKDLVPGKIYYSNTNAKLKCLKHEKDGVRIKTDVKEIVISYTEEGKKAYNLFESVSEESLKKKAEAAVPKTSELPEPKTQKEKKTMAKIKAEQKVKFISDAKILKEYNLSEGLANKEGVVSTVTEVPAFNGYQASIKVDGKEIVVTNFQARKCLVKVKRVKTNSKLIAAVRKAKKSMMAVGKFHSIRTDLKASPGNDAGVVGSIIKSWKDAIAVLEKDMVELKK